MISWHVWGSHGFPKRLISVEKSHCFAVSLPQRKKLANVTLNGSKLAVKSNVDMLGVTLVMAQAKKGSTGKTSKALKSAKKTRKRLNRLRYAPLDFESKETCAGIGALSPLIYGQAGRSLPADVLNSLRRSALQGIWRGAGNLSCAEIAFTLFLKGHKVDPVQVTEHSAFQALLRMLAKNGEASELAHSSWNLTRDLGRRSLQVIGPVTRIRKLFASCRWSWPQLRRVKTHSNKSLPLPTCPRSGDAGNDLIQHELRDAIRRREWREAASRRKDMSGIQHGIDRGVSMQLHNDKAHLTEYQRACLRAILSGAVNATERRERHKSRGASSGTCPFCSCSSGETVFHRWWVCPQWQYLRAPVLAEPDSMPVCLSVCGLLPETGAEVWKPHVRRIQQMMLDILVQCCLAVASQSARDAPDRPPQTDNRLAQDSEDVPVEETCDKTAFLLHQLVRLSNDKLQCSVCKRVCVARQRSRLMQSSCRGNDLSQVRATPASLSRCNKTRELLVKEWEDKKPGGHTLTWNGDVKGCICCTVCTKKWQYKSGRMDWKTQIYTQLCTGNSQEADRKRQTLCLEISKISSQHDLFLDSKNDLVSCRKCCSTSAFHTWKALARKPCKPVGAQQAGASRKTLKGRGRSAPSAVD